MVLKHLSSLYPNEKLPLKDLRHKVLMLILLSWAREQKEHLKNTKRYLKSDSRSGMLLNLSSS